MTHPLPPQLLTPIFLDYIGIIICIKGRLDICVDGRHHTVSESETLFLSENIQFQITFASDDIEYSILLYRIEPIRPLFGTTVMMMRILSTLDPRPIYILPSENEEKLESYISLLAPVAICDGDHFADNERNILLMGLTYHLCSIFSSKLILSDGLAGHNMDIFTRLVELISANFSKQRGVSFYADKLCLTPKYLSSLVKRTCGYTVQELVFKAITRRAIFLLTATDRPVQEISSEMSFPNASAFGTFFKKQTGVSPKQYRERQIKGEDNKMG
ncbi:MAG: helix-turn-helix domain-containing protein [Prevotella sp.]